MRPRRESDTPDFVMPSSGPGNVAAALHPSAEATLRVISDTNELATLEEKWNDLVARSPVTAYQTYEWNALWWRHFGGRRGQKLHVLVFESGDEIIGIVPLLSEPVSIAGLVVGRRLRFLGSGFEYGPSDYLDAIVPEQYEDQFLTAFRKYITSVRDRYSQIFLSDVPEESILVRRFASSVEMSDMPTSVSPSDLCPRIRVPESGELYLRSRKPEVRRRLRQVKNSLAKHFSVNGTLSERDVEHAIKELIKLHQDRWTSLGYPGVYSDPDFCRFQYDIASVYAKKKWLWLRSLSYNDRIVAVRLGFRFKNRFYDYMSGFESMQEVSRLRPGLALLSVMLDEAIQEQADWLDLLRGNEPYKSDYATEARRNWNIAIRLNTRASVSYALFTFAVRWTKLLYRMKREHHVFLVLVSFHGSLFSALWYYFASVARRAGKHLGGLGHGSVQGGRKGNRGTAVP